MPKGKKKGKSKHGFGDSEEEEGDAPAPQPEQVDEEAAAAKKEKKNKKKAKKAKEAAQDVESATAPAQDEPAEPVGDGEDEEGEDDLGESLIIAEVYEVKSHPKLPATQQLVTLFDGQDMYKVVTEYPVQDEDLVVYAKAGCILPGTQQRVGQQKIKGVKSEGKICNAYEVGWLGQETDEMLLLEEDWGIISGDICPMAPPSGWVQLQEEEAEEQEAEEKEEDDAMSEDDGPRTSAAATKGGNGDKKASAFAALMDEDEDMAEEEEPEPAPEPKRTGAKNGKGKTEKPSKSMAFAALMGSDDDASEEEVVEPKKSKGKKGGSAFDTLMGSDDEDEEPAPPPASSKFKKKDKKGKAAKSAFSGLLSDDDTEEQPKAEDKEVNLLTAPVDSLEGIEQVTAALALTGISKTRKLNLKQRLKKLEEDALLADLEASPAPNGSAKKASPTKAAAETPQEVPVQEMTSVEDVQSAMDAPGMSKTRKQKLKQRLKQLQDEQAAASGGGEKSVTELPVDELTTVEQVQEALDVPGVSKTRKQKLKQRLKALQEKDKPKEEPKEAAAEAEPKGGKGKKPSAAVRAMQQQVEERRKAEEEAKAAAEAKRLAEEEAVRQAELAAQQEEEERIRKAEEKKAQREQMRKEGKLLSAKQKAEQRKLAAERELRLAQAQEAGLSLDAPGERLTAAQQEEKRRQAKKRQKELAEQRAKEQAAAELAALEKKRAAEKAEREAAEKKKKEEAEKAAKKSEAADDWEDEVPDDWDASEGGSEAAEAKEEEGADAEKAEDDAEEDDTDESSSDEESSEEESSDDDDDDDDSSDYSTDSEEEREQRLAEARAKREARFSQAMSKRSKDDLRSPICCILGHVDTGKTKILDNIRRTNVQTGEAGGITQQIGATYIPSSAVENRTVELRKDKAFDMKMPGLLVIDTPGHESFSNLRSRGSSLCDIAVLVVDIMHGLEQQTIESIQLLKMRKSPFVIALNKIDRMYNWKVMENGPVRDSLEQQQQATKDEFERRCSDSMLALNEQGLNVELYWRNRDPRRFVNIVPTSAITGEGICDLMWLLVKLTQSMMMDRLMFVEELQCTVLEVKVVEGYGHTIDAVLVNGRIREGDKVVICGLQGPIVTTVRSLLTPHPLKELRVKNTYIHHKEIKAAQGIKVSAPNLEHAVAGTQMYVVGKDDDEEELKELVMEDMSDIFDKKEPEGVCVQASTLGSLEALLEFLSSDAVQIPVSGINIGPVHKKDVMRANIMAEKKLKKYSCILAFDVPINKEATSLANSLGVTIFSADIIYHLFDMFTDYTKKCKAEEKAEAQMDAVFPCRMRIVPNCVFNAKDPIVLGCEIIEGQLRMGTPITIPGKDCDLGRVAGMEKDHKAVEIAERGDSVAVKIEATNSTEGSRLFGRHFLETDELYSKISRESINSLKAHFRDEMTQPLWQLVIKLKKVFKID